MALQPWYTIAVPRKDLREGKPLDASEFAVHLDRVRDGTAPEDYTKPERFFERTYLTKSLTSLGAQVIRRLSDITTETSAVFNLSTQFGGGKTHALTMLYHLASAGKKAAQWAGVKTLLERAGVESVPKAGVATFVGTEFDAVKGRGGHDGTPLRRTPWGEIAWQLGGAESFAAVAAHDKSGTAPAGDVIREMLPKKRPSLILLDELINFVSRNRKSGLSAQLYSFLQNLSESVRGETNAVLVVSIPASELEMSADDQEDFSRYKKLLDRLGKAMVMSAESEASEIIRRRLFDWNGLPSEAGKAAQAYAEWILTHRDQLPKTFPIDNAREAVEASYPFHPTVLSVFERKWQSLPRFQQTRGILRLLALWVSSAYGAGYKKAHGDPLIGMGTAPLDDPQFRTAMLEQLGEPRLEAAITSDICGKRGSFAVRLDDEGVEAIQKSRLHRKAATVVFFESNGGQAKEGVATVPEIRLALGEPGMDIGNVETVLDTLADTCYYLNVEKTQYRFSLKPNLNKILADRKATVAAAKTKERVRNVTMKVFKGDRGVTVVPFPESSGQIADSPAIRLVLLASEHSVADPKTSMLVDSMIREHGNSGRTFKSAVIFSGVESDATLQGSARDFLAWEAIKDDDQGSLDASQKAQLVESLGRAERDLTESVWRSYNNLLLLGKDGKLKRVDLGLLHSSQSTSMVQLIIDRLRSDGDIEETVNAKFLDRRWPAFAEWSTKAVRDAFFATPAFPRLLNPEVVKDTIANGVSAGILAYVGKGPGGYDPFYFECDLRPDQVEISDEMFILRAAEAKKAKEPSHIAALSVEPQTASVKPGGVLTFHVVCLDQYGQPFKATQVTWSTNGGRIDANGEFTAGSTEGSFRVLAKVDALDQEAIVDVASVPVPPPDKPKPVGFDSLVWSGDVPVLKWSTFYGKVLAPFVTGGGLKLTVSLEVRPGGGIQPHQVEETNASLRELGLKADAKGNG